MHHARVRRACGLTPHVAAGCLLLVAALAPADLRVERKSLDAEQETLYRMSIRDRTAEQAIAAFVKQTGITVINGVPPDDGGGPVVVYDVNFDGLTRAEALHELARALSVTLIHSTREPPRLMSSVPPPDVWKEPPHQPVRVASVSRNQSLPPTPARPDSLFLQFNVDADTAAGDGGLQLNVTAATDEQGRDLTPAAVASVDVADPSNRPAVLDVRLPCPSPAPQRVALLRGTFSVVRPKTVLRVTADAFPDTEQTADLEGATLKIGPLTAGANGLSLPVEIARGTLDAEKWKALRTKAERFDQDAVVRDPDGQVLRLVRRSSENWADTIKMATAVIRPGPPRQSDGPRPAVRLGSLQWDMVLETTGRTTPFEFRDIAVP